MRDYEFEFQENILNNQEWFEETIEIQISRLGLIHVIGVMELGLRHPVFPNHLKPSCEKIGRSMVTRLIDDGLEIPLDTLQCWRKTFKIEG